jgi:hypothetical protein
LVIVRLLAPEAVADNALVATERATARQLLQRRRGYPGSVLFSAPSDAIKSIKAGVKARPWNTLQRFNLVADLHPPVKVIAEREKNNAF